MWATRDEVPSLAETIVATPDAVSAPSAPAPTTSQRLAALSGAERAEWQKSGTLPDISPAVASHTAEPDDQVAATAAVIPAASEPAKAKGADSRKAELAAEINALLEQRAKLRQELNQSISTRPAASSAATADPKPDINAYNDSNGGLTKYIDDLTAWATGKVFKERDAATATQTAAERQRAEVLQLEEAWNQRVTTAKTKHADFDGDLVSKLIPPKSLVDAWINEQEPETAADVLYHFQTHPTEVTRILQLPMTRQVRELVLIEQQAALKPTIKRHTTAPNTGEVLGVRGTDASDETTRARRNKDVRGYIDAANRADLAARKGL